MRFLRVVDTVSPPAKDQIPQADKTLKSTGQLLCDQPTY